MWCPSAPSHGDDERSAFPWRARRVLVSRPAIPHGRPARPKSSRLAPSTIRRPAPLRNHSFRVVTRAGSGRGRWPERGCIGCFVVADQVAHSAHLGARGTSLVSRGSQDELQRLEARMGDHIPWYTLMDDFYADLEVDEWHGTNRFTREGDR